MSKIIHVYFAFAGRKTRATFLAARMHPRLVPVTCICFEFDWFIVLFSNNLEKNYYWDLIHYTKEYVSYISPEQFAASSCLNPEEHSHLYDPSVLTHSEPYPHVTFNNEHSSTSEKEDKKGQKSKAALAPTTGPHLSELWHETD